MLQGTASGEVLEVGAGDGENLHAGPLLEGHGGDELWGLAANPTKEEFCTVGDDALLRMVGALGLEWSGFYLPTYVLTNLPTYLCLRAVERVLA